MYSATTYTFTLRNDTVRTPSPMMLAIAPSDTMQVWAGTGEPNSRNTIEPGQGIYKSTDGGLTWKLMGLEKTQHIGRIAVHPTNPNVVYVAGLGAAWKANRRAIGLPQWMRCRARRGLRRSSTQRSATRCSGEWPDGVHRRSRGHEV